MNYLKKKKISNPTRLSKVKKMLLDGGWGCCSLSLLRYACDGGGQRSAGYCK